MRRSGALVFGLLVAGCHLADDIDPPRCEPGFHVELQRCVPDDVAEKRIRIAAASGGTSCGGGEERPPVLDPPILVVKANEPFQFENTDVVAHEIRGVAGEVWLVVPPQEMSDFRSIAKPGTWEYRVSGCSEGGAVRVE